MGKQRRKKKSIAVDSPHQATTEPQTIPASPGGSHLERTTTLRTVLLSLFLFAVVLGVFWPCVNDQFLNYDDNEYITENTHVTQGLSAPSIVWAFTTGAQANWHPLTWLSHMLDCDLYGVKPAGHHFTSVLLHALNAALLFLLLNQMTGAVWRSLAVAALFGLHPLRVESVAWAAERKDVLSTLFWLLTMWSYFRYTQKRQAGVPGRGFYALTLVLFALAIMSKPMVVTLPFALLLLDAWPLRRINPQNWKKLFVEKIPFFALAASSCVVTYLVQQHGGAVHAEIPFGLRFETALTSYFTYLGKIFWPTNLVIIYPYQIEWPGPIVAACAVCLVAIFLLALIYRKRLPWLGVGWFWYVGTLVPVIGLVQTGAQSMADRYTYIPSIGIAVLVVWGMVAMVGRWKFSTAILIIALAITLTACTILTRRQLSFWKDSQTVFTHALEVTQKNVIAYLKLGVFLYGKGEHDAAITLLAKGVQEIPDAPMIRNNLGFYYKEQHRFPEAELQLREAVRLQPDYPEADANLAYLCLISHRQAEGVALLKHALELRPHFPYAEKLLSKALETLPKPPP